MALAASASNLALLALAGATPGKALEPLAARGEPFAWLYAQARFGRALLGQSVPRDFDFAAALHFALACPDDPLADDLLEFCRKHADPQVRSQALEALVKTETSPFWSSACLDFAALEVKRGNPASAKALLERLVRLRPVSPVTGEALYQLARVAWRLRDYSTALTACKTLEHRFPFAEVVPQAQLVAAQVHLDEGDPDQALSVLESLVKTRPDSQSVRRAAQLYDQLEPDTYRLEGRFRCDEAEDHFNRAKRLFAEGKYADAAEGFELFLVWYPTSEHCPEALFRYAQCLEKTGKDWSAAVENLCASEVSLEYAGDLSPAVLAKHRAFTKTRLKELQDACSAYFAVLATYPGSRFQWPACLACATLACKVGDVRPLHELLPLFARKAPTSDVTTALYRILCEAYLGPMPANSAGAPVPADLPQAFAAPLAGPESRAHVWCLLAASSNATPLALGEVKAWLQLFDQSEQTLDVGACRLTGPPPLLQLAQSTGLADLLEKTLPSNLQASLSLAALSPPERPFALAKDLKPVKVASGLFATWLDGELEAEHEALPAARLAQGLAEWLALATCGQSLQRAASQAQLEYDLEQAVKEANAALALFLEHGCPYAELTDRVALGMMAQLLGSPFKSPATLPAEVLEAVKQASGTTPLAKLRAGLAKVTGQSLQERFAEWGLY